MIKIIVLSLWFIFSNNSVAMSYETEESRQYFFQAQREKNVNLCSKVIATKRDNCISNVGERTRDEKICNMISDKKSWFYNRCYYDVAKKKPDITLCNAVRQDVTQQNLCHSHHGYRCERKNNVLDFQTLCFRSVADVIRMQEAGRELKIKQKTFTIAECESKTGITWYGDHGVSNVAKCYSQEFAEGNYQACLKTGGLSCLSAASLREKRYLCDALDNYYAEKLCIKRLFDYYDQPKKWNLHEFGSVDNVRRELVVEGNTMYDIGQKISKMKEYAHLPRPLNQESLFKGTENKCNGQDILYRFTGSGANHKIGDPIFYIKSCAKISNDQYKATILVYQ